MTNPESSVRKNINIKFKKEANVSDLAEFDSATFLTTSASEGSVKPSHYNHGNDNFENRSRSSRSRSHSSSSSHSYTSSRSRSRSGERTSRRRDRHHKYDRSRSRSRSYSSSTSTVSPQRSFKSPIKKPREQFGEKITDWNFQINFGAERIQDPTIFICDICRLPVINYGRLLPCKHTFCHPCAAKMQGDENQKCTKCRNPINSVEMCSPGVLFVCTFGGSKIQGGCRRAYRSTEDLQTHGNQRHNGSTGNGSSSESGTVESASSVLASIVPPPMPVSLTSAIQSFSGTNLFQARPNPGTAGFVSAPFSAPMMAQAAAFQQAFHYSQQNQAMPFPNNPPPAPLLFRGPINQQQQQQPPPLIGPPGAAFFMAAGMMNGPQPTQQQQQQQQNPANSLLMAPGNLPPPQLVTSIQQQQQPPVVISPNPAASTTANSLQ